MRGAEMAGAPCLPSRQFRDRSKRRGSRRRSHQMEGGARARNRKYGDAANAGCAAVSSRNRANVAGTGTTGATEGADVLANWIKAQIGQSKSAEPLGW